MMTASVARHGPSMILIEGALTALTLATAFLRPTLGADAFARAERRLSALARRRTLSVFAVGLAAFFLRLAILPLSPVPKPFVQDDFSFLLAADTFASGRLTNPTPRMWEHFESFQLTMKPTYMSMYFPAQGMVLAAGKILTGHPWFGVLFANALMCAAICWALQAWLPSGWALLGGVLAILRLSLFSYWIDTYSGGGAIAALGGALILGALPRFLRDPRLGYSMPMAIGAALLAISRPYEGILLCLPVAAALVWRIRQGRPHLDARALLRCAALPLATVLAVVAWMGYYDYRAFGHPLTPPYAADRAEYAVVPYFVWQPQRPEPVYRHKELRDFYLGVELHTFQKIHSLSGFLPQNVFKALRGILFFSGIALLPPLLMLRRVFLDRRIRFLMVCVVVLAVGMLPQVFLIPHYIAPCTVAFYAIGLQAMRHLRQWRPEGAPAGLFLSRGIVALCCLLAAVRLFAAPLGLSLPVWPGVWASEWFGSAPAGLERARIQSELEKLPGPQLVLVQYSASHDSMDEWVYNDADIDRSRVIWARAMDRADDLDLIHFYAGRTAWLLQPDLQPAKLSPYPVQRAAKLP